MGVRTLEGTYDGTTPAAVMVDSTNGWPVGPIFEGDEAVEQIEEFQRWMAIEPWLRVPDIGDLGGLYGHELPLPTAKASDPRAWPNAGLQKLVRYWREHFLDEDGHLISKPVEG